MLHAYSMAKECKNLYYTVTPLTKEILDVIISNLNLMGIVDVAYNLHFQQLRISIPKEMSSNIVDLILSASPDCKIQPIVQPEVSSSPYKASCKPS